MKKYFSKLKEKILNLVFPEVCLLCGKENAQVCKSCFEKLPKKYFDRDEIFSFYEYRNPLVEKLLWNLKYHHSHSVAKEFGMAVGAEISQMLNGFVKSKSDENSKINFLLLPIPLSNGDNRMHNHASLLAENILNFLKRNTSFTITILPEILSKNNSTKQAHTKTRMSRLENMKNKFHINGKFSDYEFPKNSIVILVDDITTTGATLNEAKKCLHDNFPTLKNIFAVTVAH